MILSEKLLNLVFPPRCIFCNDLLETGIQLNICEACYNNIPFIQDNPVRIAGWNSEGSCNAVISACRYSGIVKYSLVRYKFYKRPGYHRTYAKLLTNCIKQVTNFNKFDMIVSVPLHKNREFSRGYNQALLIAKALGRETGISECSELLKRVRYTEAQSQLDRKSRNINIKGAFSVTDIESVKNRSILLVDDILTTGNTINECGRVLKEAGARFILAVVVATGQAV